EDLLRIGIDQELVRIEAQSALRVIRAVNAVAVELAGSNIAEVAVPDILGTFRKCDALDLPTAITVKQAKFDLFRVRRKQREIRSASVPGTPQRRRRTSRNAHATAPEREKLQQGAEQQD